MTGYHSHTKTMPTILSTKMNSGSRVTDALQETDCVKLHQIKTGQHSLL